MSSHVLSLLDSLAEERQFCHGYQVAVFVNGLCVIDHAAGVDGLGRPMTAGSTVAMYCAAKSLTVIAAASLISIGELSFDDRVGDLVELCSPHVASLTIEDVVSHRSGARHPTAIEGTTMAPHRREATALLQPSPNPPLRIDETLYSESAGWLILAACLRGAAGRPILSLVNELVLEPLSLLDQFDLEGADKGRRRVAVSLRHVRPMPLLLEAGTRLAFSTNPGYGGFATMRGLASLFQHLVAPSGSNGLRLNASVADQLLTPGPLRWDRQFQRTCSFGRGFATDLDSHGFGRSLSSRAIGQAGLVGMTTCVADPDTGLSFAVHLNGLTDGDSVISWLRPALTERIIGLL